jgi:hypothetical protein
MRARAAAGVSVMMIRDSEDIGRILTIEHPGESVPALLVFSSNAGQLLRGDEPTAVLLNAMRQCAHRKGVPFVMHFQETDRGLRRSVGMTRLLENIFGNEVSIFRHGAEDADDELHAGFDQYIVSSKELAVRARSVIQLPTLERRLLYGGQRAAMHTSYNWRLPDGEEAYLITSGFHYDLGFTRVSKQISQFQAQETRRSVERMLVRDLNLTGIGGDESRRTPIYGRKALITFSGDGNTHGPLGTRWQPDQIAALRRGLGEEVKEATEAIEVTAQLSRSMQQEAIERKHPWLVLAGTLVDDMLSMVDEVTHSKWGERKLDHQFYCDFAITPSGEIAPLDAFDVVENHVFYGYGNADHYVISTLFGYRNSK